MPALSRRRAVRLGRRVYVENPHAPEPKPLRALAGFAKVSLAPGETRNIRVAIERRALAWWDEQAGTWNTSPGEYRARIGASVGDLRLSAVFGTGGGTEIETRIGKKME